ncbi:unnamed protein product [Clonostachys rhizophaga]|uniref:PhoD-like phosphatase metallophosphatase domain-containing protein n=1 Tax=Clonostachys rhizophaga TaxID=160324 RepID=A0A9N9VBC5_9HYPO|nr:unnamed protein product [Clonostachys rhizophaga]
MIRNSYLFWGLEGLAISTSFALRSRAVAFVRWNPWGQLLLEKICGLWALFLVIWITQYSLWATTPRNYPSQSLKIPAWLSVLLGRFDPQSWKASIATLGVNTLFLLAAVDFVYRSSLLHESRNLSFSRMGHTNASNANIVFRYPAEAKVRIQYRPQTGAEASTWLNGPVTSVTSHSDYIGSFLLRNLEPDTKYQYRTNASHSGTFRTPSKHPKRWTLVSSSCIKPFYPYNPLDHALSMRGFAHLSRYIENTQPDMMLFLGDFIYIDLPRRFGYETKHYQNAYRQIYASPSWTETLRALPWIHTYDDHEITNNWDANETGIYHQAISPFMVYQYLGNPEPPKPKVTYHQFSHGDVSFFLMDTRRYRSPSSDPDGEHKSMLGAEQRKDFEDWIRNAPGWKVVVTGAPFTRNFRSADNQDTWAGYLWERQRLLNLMWETDGVIILSGDRHEHATTAFPRLGHNDSSVIEFSTSPLNQFLPPAPDYEQIEDTDVGIYFLHAGESKFGAITFDTSDEMVWRAEFELIVDGEKKWDYVILQERSKEKKTRN